MILNIVRDVALPVTWLLLHTSKTTDHLCIIFNLIILISSFVFLITTKIGVLLREPSGKMY
jgi:hypothetical protein